MPKLFFFKKYERLTRKKNIDKLFSEGKHLYIYPLHIIYLTINESQSYPARVLFCVSRKKFKKAVKRNLIRRRMKEAYRKNKHILYQHLYLHNKKLFIAFIYDSQEIFDYKYLESKIIDSFNDIINQLK